MVLARNSENSRGPNSIVMRVVLHWADKNILSSQDCLLFLFALAGVAALLLSDFPEFML
jgi:hypothetical protein